MISNDEKLREGIRWMAQTVHQVHHQDQPGTFKECPKSICKHATELLDNEEKLEQVLDEIKEDLRNNCRKCGAPQSEHEVRNFDPVARDGDVHCKKCGEYVRMWAP